MTVPTPPRFAIGTAFEMKDTDDFTLTWLGKPSNGADSYLRSIFTESIHNTLAKSRQTVNWHYLPVHTLCKTISPARPCVAVNTSRLASASCNCCKVGSRMPLSPYLGSLAAFDVITRGRRVRRTPNDSIRFRMLSGRWLRLDVAVPTHLT